MKKARRGRKGSLASSTDISLSSPTSLIAPPLALGGPMREHSQKLHQLLFQFEAQYRLSTTITSSEVLPWHWFSHHFCAPLKYVLGEGLKVYLPIALRRLVDNGLLEILSDILEDHRFILFEPNDTQWFKHPIFLLVKNLTMQTLPMVRMIRNV